MANGELFASPYDMFPVKTGTLGRDLWWMLYRMALVEANSKESTFRPTTQ